LDERSKKIPVALLTILSEPEDVIRRLEGEADSFTTKPYNEQTLIARTIYVLSNAELRTVGQVKWGIE
jgi:two-component system cell cycle response regulator